MDSMQTNTVQMDSATPPWGFAQNDGRGKPEWNDQVLWAGIDLGKMKISKTWSLWSFFL